MNGWSIASLLLPLVGCKTHEEPFSLSVDATGVTKVRADLDQGSLSYQGAEGAAAFAIEGTSVGAGSSTTKAEEREAGNTWSAEAQGGVLEIRTTSEHSRAWVELDVSGPAAMDLEVVSGSGVKLTDVAGVFTVNASTLTARGLVGEADVSCVHDVDLEIWPDPGGAVLIESSGDVRLALPYGEPYDIEVWGNAEYEWSIEDLGFDLISYGEGTFDAEIGDASIEIKVIVESGTFTLEQAG